MPPNPYATGTPGLHSTKKLMVSRFNQGVGEPTVSDITPEMEEGWGANGWSPEAIEMIKQLHNSGLPIKLAAVAAKDIMGLNSPPPTEWETFEQEHPYRAATKKLVNKGGEIAGGIAQGFTRPAVPDIEKISAAKMLKDYLMAQDAQRANQAQSQALWSTTNPAELNKVFAAQDNAIYDMNYRKR